MFERETKRGRREIVSSIEKDKKLIEDNARVISVLSPLVYRGCMCSPVYVGMRMQIHDCVHIS